MNIDEIRDYVYNKNIEGIELYFEDRLTTQFTCDHISVDIEEIYDRGLGIRLFQKRKLGTASCTLSSNTESIFDGIDKALDNSKLSRQYISDFSRNQTFFWDTELKGDNKDNVKKVICNKYNLTENFIVLKHEQVRYELVTYTSHIINHINWYQLDIVNKKINNLNTYIFDSLDKMPILECEKAKIIYNDSLKEKYDIIELSAEVNSFLIKFLGSCFLCSYNLISNIILDKQMFSDKLNLYDNGEINRIDSFNKFDVEGSVKTNIQLIDNGRPQKFLYNINDSYSKGCEPTGNAIRKSYNFLPAIDNNCIYQPEGNYLEYSKIINNKRVLHINKIFQNACTFNQMTGDFEGVAEINYIIYGEISDSKLVNVKGNIFKLYNKIIEIGNYSKEVLYTNNQVIAPSIIIEALL